MSSPLLKERFQIAKRSAFILSSLTFFRDILEAYSWTTMEEHSLLLLKWRPHVIAACNKGFRARAFFSTFNPRFLFDTVPNMTIHHQPIASLYQPSKHPNNTNISIESIDMTSLSSTNTSFMLQVRCSPSGAPHQGAPIVSLDSSCLSRSEALLFRSKEALENPEKKIWKMIDANVLEK